MNLNEVIIVTRNFRNYKSLLSGGGGARESLDVLEGEEVLLQCRSHHDHHERYFTISTLNICTYGEEVRLQGRCYYDYKI